MIHKVVVKLSTRAVASSEGMMEGACASKFTHLVVGGTTPVGQKPMLLVRSGKEGKQKEMWKIYCKILSPEG